MGISTSYDSLPRSEILAFPSLGPELQHLNSGGGTTNWATNDGISLPLPNTGER